MHMLYVYTQEVCHGGLLDKRAFYSGAASWRTVECAVTAGTHTHTPPLPLSLSLSLSHTRAHTVGCAVPSLRMSGTDTSAAERH